MFAILLCYVSGPRRCCHTIRYHSGAVAVIKISFGSTRLPTGGGFRSTFNWRAIHHHHPVRSGYTKNWNAISRPAAYRACEGCHGLEGLRGFRGFGREIEISVMLVTNTSGDRCVATWATVCVYVCVRVRIYGRIIQTSRYTQSPMHYSIRACVRARIRSRIDFQYLCGAAPRAKVTVVARRIADLKISRIIFYKLCLYILYDTQGDPFHHYLFIVRFLCDGQFHRISFEGLEKTWARFPTFYNFEVITFQATQTFQFFSIS